MIKLVAVAALAAFTFSGAAYAADTAAPSDAEIAHIAYTAGQLDITAAQQALAKTENAEVRGFAELMERDHSAVNKAALELVDKLGVTPEDNPTSQALTDQADDVQAKLDKLSGAAFDIAYIQNEVVYHQTVNNALTDTLIPSAQNPELKAFLETGLKLFQEHLDHAEALAKTVQ